MSFWVKFDIKCLHKKERNTKGKKGVRMEKLNNIVLYFISFLQKYFFLYFISNQNEDFKAQQSLGPFRPSNDFEA